MRAACQPRRPVACNKVIPDARHLQSVTLGEHGRFYVNQGEESLDGRMPPYFWIDIGQADGPCLENAAWLSGRALVLMGDAYHFPKTMDGVSIEDGQRIKITGIQSFATIYNSTVRVKEVHRPQGPA